MKGAPVSKRRYHNNIIVIDLLLHFRLSVPLRACDVHTGPLLIIGQIGENAF